MSINEIESKARELRQLQALIDEATAEAEALKDAIKAAMGDAEEVHAGEYKITWKPVTAYRLDTAALKKALPDVAERFTKQSTTRRFVWRNRKSPCGVASLQGLSLGSYVSYEKDSRKSGSRSPLI